MNNSSAKTFSVRTTMRVEGICCPSEVPLIENILSTLPGVAKVSVNVPNRLTIVEHNPSLTSPATLVNELNNAALGASIKQNESVVAPPKYTLPRWDTWLVGLLFFISMVAHVDDSMRAWEYVAIGAIAIGIPPILKRALASLSHYVLDINTLMSLAVVGAMAIGDFSEGAAVVFLFRLSEWMENLASQHARHSLASIVSMQPETAERHPDGSSVLAEKVMVGDVLQVRRSKVVPAHCLLLGETWSESSC